METRIKRDKCGVCVHTLSTALTLAEASIRARATATDPSPHTNISKVEPAWKILYNYSKKSPEINIKPFIVMVTL